MSTTKTTNRRTGVVLLLIAIGLTVVVGIGLLLQKYGPGDMGNGFLVGAGIAVVAVLIMGWRVAHAGSGATRRRPRHTAVPCS